MRCKKASAEVGCQTEEELDMRRFSITSDILPNEERKVLDDQSFISDYSNTQDIVEQPVKKSRKPANLLVDIVEPKFSENENLFIASTNPFLPTETPKFNLQGGFFSKQIFEEPKTPLRKSVLNDSSFDIE